MDIEEAVGGCMDHGMDGWIEAAVGGRWAATATTPRNRLSPRL